MPKVWNIGNTTVRNPKRIENALSVFVNEGFSGNAKGIAAEQRLHYMLREKQVLEFEGSPSEFNGRKWRAAFYQLGFISFEQYKINEQVITVSELFTAINIPNIEDPYQLTPAGNKLIHGNSVPEIQEIYLRQFACYEIPNSLEVSYPEGKMKPFVLFLQVLFELQARGQSGLNKFETGLFIQKFRDHVPKLYLDIVDEILQFRSLINNAASGKEIREIREEYLKTLQSEIGIDPLTCTRDYSDTTFRYFYLSGLFTRIADTIIIRPNKVEFVKILLQTEPDFIFYRDPVEYFKQFYSNGFIIPTDILSVALNEVQILLGGIRNQKNELYVAATKLTEHSTPESIQEIRYKLIEYNNWEKEEDFALEQKSENAINNTIKYLRVLNNEPVADAPEIDDKPAFLEWAVWRSFLAINDIKSPIHQTRRFPIDEDLMPRNTAPGGGADLVFEFATFVLIVEVTLTVSHRQMAVESEPVRRHLVYYKELYKHKEVYCLFVAPAVDNNVAETFRIGIWYKLDIEEFINIVPMSLSEFISIMQTFQKSKFKNQDFLTLLLKCLSQRNIRAPQWKNSITKEIALWNSLIENYD